MGKCPLEIEVCLHRYDVAIVIAGKHVFTSFCPGERCKSVSLHVEVLVQLLFFGLDVSGFHKFGCDQLRHDLSSLFGGRVVTSLAGN